MGVTKILILDTYYPEFVRRFYNNHPQLTTTSYDEQLTALLRTHFGTGDAYSRYLQPLRYDARDIIVDNVLLQTQWAKEHHLTIRHWPHLPLLGQFTDRLPLYKILQAQIDDFLPDILYLQNLSFCDPLTLCRLKRKVKLLVGQIACPLPPDSFIKPFDLILTSFPHFVQRIKVIGPASEYFKIGFDEAILTALTKTTEKKYEVVFIGGFTKIHDQATLALETLARSTRVDVWGYGIEHLADNSPLRRYYHGEVWGLEMYTIIKQAKVCINRHSAAAEQYANNMRLYETTGLGTFLITDHKKNLADLFDIDKEIISYQSADDLVKKVAYYLNHDWEREQIALAGQQRTLRDHTYAQRMKELAGLLTKYCSQC